MSVQMVGVETIMTGIMDTWQSLVLHWQYRVFAVICVCTVGFLLGIPCTTQVLPDVYICILPSTKLMSRNKRLVHRRQAPMHGSSFPLQCFETASVTQLSQCTSMLASQLS